jgi:hypothetical protein
MLRHLKGEEDRSASRRGTGVGLGQDGRVLIVRATKKLLDRIGPPSLGEGEQSTTLLGQWYATAMSERWPQRRYVTGPERVGPGVRRPARNRLFCAAQPPCDHHLQAAPVGREAASKLGQALGPPPPTRLPIANVHADRRISMCKSNVLYSAMAGRSSAKQPVLSRLMSTARTRAQWHPGVGTGDPSVG